MERPWSADSIRFVYRSSSEEVLDVHHPYICCQLQPNETKENPEQKLDRHTRILLSFAIILFEIETGHKVMPDTSALAKSEDLEEILWQGLDARDREGKIRDHYWNSILGCTKFRAIVKQQSKSGSQEVDTKKILYNNVIKHLEQHLNSFRKIFRTRQTLRLKDGSMRSQKPTITREISHLLTSPMVHSRSVLSSAIDGAGHHPLPHLIMFDGEKVAANHE